MEVLCLTHGQFSLIDALTVLLSETGPADVQLATWTAGAADLAVLEEFVRAGRMTSFRLLIDEGFWQFKPRVAPVLRELFGPDAIATCKTHAKFATIRTGEWDLAIRTSMNLNRNPRLEMIEVSDDAGLCDFLSAQVRLAFDGGLVVAGSKARSGARRDGATADVPLVPAAGALDGVVWDDPRWMEV